MVLDYQIRFANTSDILQIMTVHRQAVLGRKNDFYDQGTLEAWALNPMDKSDVARITAEVSDPDFIVLLAEEKSKVLGFAMVKCTGGELRAVYVAPNRPKGVGSQLLARIEEEAHKRGVKKLGLDSSLNAKTFYMKHGYQEITHAIHYFNNGQEVMCIKMEKPLLTPNLL